MPRLHNDASTDGPNTSTGRKKANALNAKKEASDSVSFGFDEDFDDEDDGDGIM